MIRDIDQESAPEGRQFELLKNNYLNLLAKYEHRINELSILKELIESVTSLTLADQELIWHKQLESLIRYKSLSGAVLYYIGTRQEQKEKFYALSFDHTSDYADLLRGAQVLDTIVNEKEPILVADLGKHGKLNMINGSMLALPLVSGDESIGALILFRNLIDGFPKTDISFFSIVRDHLINTIAFQRFYFEKIEEERHISQLSRFFSKGVVKKILESSAPRLGGERKKACVLFADLQGFTALSEQLASEQVVEVLNNFFHYMIPIVFQNHGTLDKLIGDCIMTVFGAPIDDKKDCYHAVKTALEMFVVFNRLKDKKGGVYQHLKMTVGINFGELIVGFIGEQNHLDYTVIGDTVNSAQRLQSMAGGNEIFISESVLERTGKDLNTMENIKSVHDLGTMTLKGKSHQLKVYKIIPEIC
ncbi:MAG: adenylate/guanylate cyclase domain-containing protein [Desulfobacter postgatei]|uniref:adenylate/guanylate cyclase domain-containing protein n=1 Tax=Desulfobacter postgatei TaxID=2293 RepID=UPI0023EFD0D1|nr:adenylate/guanylate cyclase domain-containing protein [Desulfobacter postgatei]MDD4273878.1 adenylate/guanylate cyclase domain-containing protein [Desulfobacter postgatei]